MPPNRCSVACSATEANTGGACVFQSRDRPCGQPRPKADVGGFWLIEDERGSLRFDDQPVRVPRRVLADALCAEWPPRKKAIIDKPPPRPATELCRLAQSGVAPDPARYRQALIDYVPTDTLCFWQRQPSSLMEWQQRLWQPVLDRYRDDCAIVLQPNFSLAPLEPTEADRTRLTDELRRCDAFCLAGLVFLSGLSGSILIPLAMKLGWIDTEAAYRAANLEALYQQAQWGNDPEADGRLERARQSFDLAAKFLRDEALKEGESTKNA